MNRKFPSLWNPEMKEYSYMLPDGCKVYKQVTELERYAIKFREKDIILSENVVKPQRWSLELGPNITHSCDGFLARELARMLNFNPRWKVGIYYLFLNKKLWTYTEDEKGSRALMQKLLDLGKRFNFFCNLGINRI